MRRSYCSPLRRASMLVWTELLLRTRPCGCWAAESSANEVLSTRRTGGSGTWCTQPLKRRVLLTLATAVLAPPPPASRPPEPPHPPAPRPPPPMVDVGRVGLTSPWRRLSDSSSVAPGFWKEVSP